MGARLRGRVLAATVGNLITCFVKLNRAAWVDCAALPAVPIP